MARDEKRPAGATRDADDTPGYTDARIPDVREGGQVYGGGPVTGPLTDEDVGNVGRGQERAETDRAGVGEWTGEVVGGAGGEPIRRGRR